MDILIGVIMGFGCGFAVAFIVRTLRSWHEIDESEESFWRMLRGLDNYIDELEDERQELRNRLACEIKRNRRLERAQRAPDRGALQDDEARWRVGEIERQISAWEKL